MVRRKKSIPGEGDLVLKNQFGPCFGACTQPLPVSHTRRMIVAQRNSSKAEPAPKRLEAIHGQELRTSKTSATRGVPCKACNITGTSGRKAAIDGQIGTGDVRRFGSSQIGDETGYFLCLAVAR